MFIMSSPPAMVAFLAQDYGHKSVAIQIPDKVWLALIYLVRIKSETNACKANDCLSTTKTDIYMEVCVPAYSGMPNLIIFSTHISYNVEK